MLLMNAHKEEEEDEEEDETLSRMETDITDEEMARRCERKHLNLMSYGRCL